MPEKQKRTEEPSPAIGGSPVEEPSGERRPIAGGASPSKAEGETDSAGFAGLTETVTTEHATILHPDEIFRDVPKNTGQKREAFNRYNAAVRAVERSEHDLAQAGDERKQAAAERHLEAARARKEAALTKLESVIVDARVAASEGVQSRLTEIRLATQQHASAEQLAELRNELAAYEKKLRTHFQLEVAAMTHGELGHEAESVFEPVETDTHTFEVAFPGGASERLKDRRVSYATVAPQGVEGVQSGRDRRVARDDVEVTMAAADLSSAKRRILETISGFEGGFDAVNTYDKKVVTWGFVQWAGGDHSDLTAALSFIKSTHPDAFRDQLQRYGIDVVANMLVVKRQEGEALEGGDAAAAIQADPKLAAVLMHAGQDPEIQKGEVAAAASLEIDKVMGLTIKAGKHRVAFDRLLTSEYAVGLLANTAVH